MRLVFVFLLIGFTGCQQKPTTILEESADVFEARTVLMDTRSALDYSSFHLQGSGHLLVDNFLMLQNPLAAPKNQKRIFDRNLKNTIERLAARGIHPRKKVLLIGYKRDSVEIKKWKWLLNNLEISDVNAITFEQVRKVKNGRFAEIKPQPVWELKSSPELQKEFIINKSYKCFVKPYKIEKWPEEFCQ